MMNCIDASDVYIRIGSITLKLELLLFRYYIRESVVCVVTNGQTMDETFPIMAHRFVVYENGTNVKNVRKKIKVWKRNLQNKFKLKTNPRSLMPNCFVDLHHTEKGRGEKNVIKLVNPLHVNPSNFPIFLIPFAHVHLFTEWPSEL